MPITSFLLNVKCFEKFIAICILGAKVCVDKRTASRTVTILIRGRLNLMAHLHCQRQTRVQTLTRIPVL